MSGRPRVPDQVREVMAVRVPAVVAELAKRLAEERGISRGQLVEELVIAAEKKARRREAR